MKLIFEKLTEETDQIWKKDEMNSYHHDQYGFEIFKVKQQFTLYHKHQKIISVNKLATAKVISTIILNDIVYFKQFKFD